VLTAVASIIDGMENLATTTGHITEVLYAWVWMPLVALTSVSPLAPYSNGRPKVISLSASALALSSSTAPKEPRTGASSARSALPHQREPSHHRPAQRDADTDTPLSSYGCRHHLSRRLNAFACRTAYSQDHTGERHGRLISAIVTSLPDAGVAYCWDGRSDDDVVAAVTTGRLTSEERLGGIIDDDTTTLGAVTSVLVAVAAERKALAELQRATNELLPDPEGELR
jgi:hypothetical protein